jgi:peroxiredoxin
MPTVSLDKPAPDFTLPDYSGRPVSLSDYRGRQHVLLVFNRGFT